MPQLGIIPNDPLDLYLESGYVATWLRDYYNPQHFFSKVYSLAPYERGNGDLIGVTMMPTPAEQLEARLQQLQIDVVRAYGGWHPCAIAAAGKASGIPLVVSVHDARADLLHPSIVAADVVLCVSTAVQRVVMKRYPLEERVWLLPNRVDFSEMRQYQPSEYADLDARYPFRHRIVHVGRKSPEKNLDKIIRSLSILGPDYCVVAIGKGDVSEYARVARLEGVQDRCFFIDAVANRDLAKYYSWADCSCNPSSTEAFPSVVIEALACGAVVVGSSIPAIRELIADGENGLIVDDFENPGALAAALRIACENQDVRRLVRGNARKSVEQFERSRIDALEADYYRRVLDMNAAGAFRVPFTQQVRRSVRRRARHLVPGAVRNRLSQWISR